MIKIHTLPEWHAAANGLSGRSNKQLVSAITVALKRNERFYFDGLIAAMFNLRKIPHTIEIAMDAAEMTCIARLNYGAEEDESAIYAPFEIESFALLWNENPKVVHGIQGNRITLALKHGDARYPFIDGSGVTCELYLRDGVFVAQPDLEFSHELEQAA